MKTEFKESQRFTQWWLWVILIICTILPLFSIFNLQKESASDNPTSHTDLIIYLVIIFAVIVLILFMRLKTEINQTAIKISFFPFVKKTINWSDVKSAKIVNYGFVGGWGIRLGTKYGIIYNINGNKGLALELLNGKKLLIGTQKESELSEFSMIEKLAV
jgi:4-amino-4-deoxy-L-arabinose transferase-like glycosyltransferase